MYPCWVHGVLTFDPCLTQLSTRAIINILRRLTKLRTCHHRTEIDDVKTLMSHRRRSYRGPGPDTIPKTDCCWNKKKKRFLQTHSTTYMKHSNTVKPVLSGHSKLKKNKCLKHKWYLNECQKYCRMLTWSILQYFDLH